MKDCWLDPYGKVYMCSGIWSHNRDAEKILIEQYGFEDEFEIDDKYPFDTATEVLSKVYGWVRYSTCANRGWCFSKKPTQSQRDKMFDLTGYVYGKNTYDM